jgi:histone H3/H4
MLRKHANVVTLALVGVLAATGLSACKTAQKGDIADLEVTIDDFVASGYVTDASGRSLASVGVLVRLFREVTLVKKGVSEAAAHSELLSHLNAQLAKTSDADLVAFRNKHKSITKENFSLISEAAQARLAKAVIKESYASSPALSGVSKEADSVLASIGKTGGAEKAAVRSGSKTVKKGSAADAVANVYSRKRRSSFARSAHS